jgi:NAD(P)-dependent dehydrogenase (short-subunit alcohol dehydrogenase family)
LDKHCSLLQALFIFIWKVYLIFSADEFAARGCVVYATSRRLDSMKFASPSVHTKALDVTDDEMTLSVVSEIEKEAGRIDILVCVPVAQLILT